MSCNDIRERLQELWEGHPTSEIREHLQQCSDCASYSRDLRLVRAGLNLWKQDSAPEASIGFAGRLVRQLGEMSNAARVVNFFELVGRRFVYATLAAAMLVMLAISIPSSGPVRSLSANDVQIPASPTEVSVAYLDPMGDAVVQETPELPPPSSTPIVPNEVK